MSEQRKETLEKLLSFIIEVCKTSENQWFKNRLINELLVDKKESQLSNIEKYLKLDGFEIIDYSGIKNERVREQLFRDSIEMSRYRLGKFNNKIDFDEFCRYACLQVEDLFNYFYQEKFQSDIEKANNFIIKHWATFTPPKSSKISAISLKAKTVGFINEYDFQYTSLARTIDFLMEIRNELSHRNSYKENDEDNILSSLAIKNINVASSYIDFMKTNARDVKLYNKGRFIYLKRKQEYNEIIDALEILKEAVILLT